MIRDEDIETDRCTVRNKVHKRNRGAQLEMGTVREKGGIVRNKGARKENMGKGQS